MPTVNLCNGQVCWSQQQERGEDFCHAMFCRKGSGDDIVFLVYPHAQSNSKFERSISIACTDRPTCPRISRKCASSCLFHPSRSFVKHDFSTQTPSCLGLRFPSCIASP